MQQRRKTCFAFFFNRIFSGKKPGDMFCSEVLRPLLNIFAGTPDCPEEKSKQIFAALAVYIHGYASLPANNDIDYYEQPPMT